MDWYTSGRAYRELEIRDILDTHQGSGTFIASGGESKPDEAERRRRLEQIVTDLVSHAGGEGFTVAEVLKCLNELFVENRS